MGFLFRFDTLELTTRRLKKNITADVLATVWELAKSGRKGDPHGLTKPEFERAACLVSFGIHEHVASLKPRSASNGAPPPNGTAAERKIAKRLGYARAGMFWKFEAFDVAPKEAPLVHGVPRSNDARRSSTELSNTGQRVENAQNGGPNDGSLLVSPTLSAARPLVAPITLDVPVSTRKESQSKKSAKSARASGDAGDAEDAFFFSASDDDARADHSASTWEARFPVDPAEDSTTKAAREPEKAKTPSAPSSPADPFADLVAAISADTSPPPRREAFGSSRNAQMPHLLDEFPGPRASVSLDLTRLGLADRTAAEGPEDSEDPENPKTTGRESTRLSPRASSPETTPTCPPRSASPAFDPAFETLRGPEAFAFDFSGRAFGAAADASADLKSAVQGVGKDDVAIASRARARAHETDETDETDETFGVEDPEPDPEDAPLFFGSEDFSGGFLDDDGGVDPPASTSDAPRPARDPEMEEWSAACRAWPWLADEARTEERRDEKQAEAEAGWAAF